MIAERHEEADRDVTHTHGPTARHQQPHAPPSLHEEEAGQRGENENKRVDDDEGGGGGAGGDAHALEQVGSVVPAMEDVTCDNDM